MYTLIKDNFSPQEILAGEFGLERESLRVTKNGHLALTKHPQSLGNKATHPYITTDFSESQVEMITPVMDNVEECHDFMENLYNIVALEVGFELLWPQSMPCIVADETQIPVADFQDESNENTRYRKYLLNKYGGRKQIISGIHCNFSFQADFIKKLYNLSESNLKYNRFKDQLYLKVTRNYLRYRWFLIYLMGASPIIDKTYNKSCDEDSKVCNPNLPDNNVISFRNSVCGYENKETLYGNYNSVTEYVQSICEFIREGSIESHKEFYSSIRLKPHNANHFLSSLLTDGIKYLEIRSIDINPFEKVGISVVDLKFIHLFMIFCLLEPENDFKDWQEEALNNQHLISIKGAIDVMMKKNSDNISLKDWAQEIYAKLSQLNDELNLNLGTVIDNIKMKLEDKNNLPSIKLKQLVKKEGYVKAHINLANKYVHDAFNNRFKLKGYEDLELSTQILMREAYKKGITCTLIDRVENFIKLKKGPHIEYIKQATKTGSDSYITYLIMENKSVTKHVLREHKIPTPWGIELNKFDSYKIKPFLQMACVVKPKSTNFGIGISIFTNPPTPEDLEKAVDIALSFDNTVLIEEFLKGKEYRFLVIGDEVAGILHRKPANVIGDGIHTIRELAEIKSQDPLRGKGHRTPLEKIPIDGHVELFLKQSNLTINSIPAPQEIVYLRENSNISTGGDSIDYTDKINNKLKKIAVKAAHAAGAKICGVDIIIEDVENPKSKFGIIELNFNPAIHIHCFPYKGIERNIAEKILTLLDL
ncbi:bifunctional glutamate--cysteine ligase/glutathione synthetase [Candidatus Epulonipiscium fishelsonii]|uniref:Bifunctional glutamate--cysteine ligase/glutathione synthetase n=1 Tax=Candidatus Epulonipiscium fishelsonii TaxID=77094 RepID=A0ACC8XD77_9FIRM|nr:bifunctional glutamate--cysteine ligase/glutathione synthetase [Epulopiscium sp. SCG-B05WGA-EpuloA1]ONI40796.1 bifunctional glutamate--cysteine ligase/glutathione synthetase [Epulopiscium sp. SCG-B11WGA-EpuloA1]